MVFILVATDKAEAGAKLRESLGAQGWWVTIVEDRQGALRAAADHEPRVVIIDGQSAGAVELVRTFASGNGGPGAIVLSAPEDEHERMALVEAGADEMLSGAHPTRELLHAIERIAEAPHQASDPSPLPIGRQLTAEEIFGDILEEVGSKVDLVAGDPGPDAVESAAKATTEASDATARGSSGEAASGVEPEESFAGLVDGDVRFGGQDQAEEVAVDGAPHPVIEPLGGQVFEDVDGGHVVGFEDPVAGKLDPLAGLEFDIRDLEGPSASQTVRAEEVEPDIVMATEQAGQDEGSFVEVTPRAGSGSAEQADAALAASAGATSDDSEFGQYRLEERIAVGGMAEVWRASMVGLEGFRKTVAIKKILPHLAENEEFVAMFIDEAKLAAQLSHENLVDIYDLGKIDDEFFIAMEYVEGKDLRSILNRLRQRRERMPLELALFVASRISAALDYAHGRLDASGEPMGLVHRDVSPRNILISDNGNVRLCDFGVAKAVSSVARTEIGALKGKIQYMSPEQAAGARVDGRSDVYSLASVLFEMVTGRRLFVEDTEITLLDAVRSGVTDEARSVRPDLPEEINAVLRRALAKDPAERYQTAAEMQHDLDEALFVLDPKPSQGGLGLWMAEIFEDRPLEVAREQPLSVALPMAAPGQAEDSSAVRAIAEPRPSAVDRLSLTSEEASVVEESSDAAAAVEPESRSADVDGEGEAVTAISAAMRKPQFRFWLGVFAGLLLALALAFVIHLWLDRAQRSGAAGERPGSPAVESAIVAVAASDSGPELSAGKRRSGGEQASPPS